MTMRANALTWLWLSILHKPQTKPPHAFYDPPQPLLQHNDRLLCLPSPLASP